jgi:hypothetical protein
VRPYPSAWVGTNLNSQKLVLLRKRVDEFNFIQLTVIVDRGGRVTSIEVRRRTSTDTRRIPSFDLGGHGRYVAVPGPWVGFAEEVARPS